MSQESLVSQTTLADSPMHAAVWLPARSPSGYEPLSYEEDDSDVELCAIKPTSDVEASAIAIRVASPFPSSEGPDIESSPQDGPSPPRTRIFGLSKMEFVILTACGTPAALYFSALVWFVGGFVLKSVLAVPPYSDSMDSVATFKASMAGAPVVGLAVGAVVFLDLAHRRLPSLSRTDGARRTRYDPGWEIFTLCAMCAPSSVFAMPLGFVMMPGFATEAFGVWHALAVSATGLGVFLVGFSLAILCCIMVGL